MGKLLFNVLATIAEIEADLISMRTREGMKVATANSRLRGKQPSPTVKQEAHLLGLNDPGKHTMAGMAELVSMSRSTIYRAVDRGQRKKTGTITA